MTTKNRIFTFCLLVMMIMMPATLLAQQKDIAIRVFPSSWYNSYYEPAIDGYGFTIAYHPILNKVSRLNISAEFDVLKARNEFLLGFGYNYTIAQAKKYRVSVEANLLSGIDLYKPAPLYVGGLEAGARFDYYLRKGKAMFAGIGARETFCPGYKAIGVWKYSSWPVTVGLRF
jgi:hypothetical protein